MVARPNDRGTLEGHNGPNWAEKDFLAALAEGPDIADATAAILSAATPAKSEAQNASKADQSDGAPSCRTARLRSMSYRSSNVAWANGRCHRRRTTRGLQLDRAAVHGRRNHRNASAGKLPSRGVMLRFTKDATFGTVGIRRSSTGQRRHPPRPMPAERRIAHNFQNVRRSSDINSKRALGNSRCMYSSEFGGIC